MKLRFQIFKTLFCLFAAFFFSLDLSAQTAEKIYSKTLVAKSNDYYIQQHKLWKKEVEKDPKNADAWMSYFMAGRYAHLIGEDWESKVKRQDALVEELGKQLPNSFEYNYIRWWHGGNNHKLFHHLQKAYELQPDNPELYEDLATYYETVGKFNLRNEFMAKWYKAGVVSNGLLNYSYNVLMGLEPNSVLITFGDNDTYYIWMLQAAKGIRKDVTVLNMSLMSMDVYQQMMTKKLGIENLPMYDSTQNWQEYWEKFNKNFVKSIAENNKKLPVYVSLTADKKDIENVKDKLYLTGLAWKYSDERIDNIALLKRNFEQNYALDYLNIRFGQDDWDEIVRRINGNYIVPLLNLYEHYKLAGETAKAEKIKNQALAIGKDADQLAELKKYFETH